MEHNREQLIEKLMRNDSCYAEDIKTINEAIALIRYDEERIKELTVDAAEVRHGKWRDRYGGKYANGLYVCSLCEEVAPEGTVYDELDRPLRQQVLSPYCPNCGAKMGVERK